MPQACPTVGEPTPERNRGALLTVSPDLPDSQRVPHGPAGPGPKPPPWIREGRLELRRVREADGGVIRTAARQGAHEGSGTPLPLGPTANDQRELAAIAEQLFDAGISFEYGLWQHRAPESSVRTPPKLIGRARLEQTAVEGVLTLRYETYSGAERADVDMLVRHMVAVADRVPGAEQLEIHAPIRDPRANAVAERHDFGIVGGQPGNPGVVVWRMEIGVDRTPMVPPPGVVAPNPGRTLDLPGLF